MKYFILFETVAMLTEIMHFFGICIAAIVKKTNSFNTIMHLISPNSMKKWGQTY